MGGGTCILRGRTWQSILFSLEEDKALEEYLSYTEDPKIMWLLFLVPP